jgi:xanthine dehydrogenase YagT iron-sulfur-binding subunit
MSANGGRETTVPPQEAQSVVGTVGAAPISVTLVVNGAERQLDVDPRSMLVDVLRDRLGLTGTKKCCERGECGVCTVHIDGRTVLACMTLAVAAKDAEITTIEGLATDGDLHVLQRAFIEQDSFQCGYCTPGQIMSAVACIEGGHAESEDEIREFMSGNICRCSAYPQIVAAIRAVAVSAEDR